MSRLSGSLGASVLALFAGIPAEAGIPAPGALTSGIPCEPTLRSTWELVPGPSYCQYRFSANGGLDQLTVLVTLRDCYDTPVPGCPIQATLKPDAGTVEFCACEPTSRIETSDAAGAVEFRYGKVGGRGSLSVALTLLCIGAYGFPDLELDFTSPDQDGSCETGSSTTVIDLGIWAAGLWSYVRTSDFDCSGTINVLDLGLFAQGLGVGCP